MCAPEYTSTIVAESPHGVLHQGDCLEIMPTFAPQSVDMILCDLPYGTTQCKWDTVIPFEPLWREYRRLIKPRGAIVLTASQPFTSALVMSNIKEFRYEWVWEKDKATGHLNAKKMPMRAHESILIFSHKPPMYFPQMNALDRPSNKSSAKLKDTATQVYGKFKEYQRGGSLFRYPRSTQKFNVVNSAHGVLHPTQKPVALFEYLVKTYTQPGAVVLDNCAGSGTTGAACINTGRKFLLIEREQKYVDIIEKRVFSPAATLFSSELDKTTV